MRHSQWPDLGRGTSRFRQWTMDLLPVDLSGHDRASDDSEGRDDPLVHLVHSRQELEFAAALDRSAICLSIDSYVVDFIITHDRLPFLKTIVAKQPQIIYSVRVKDQQSMLHMAVARESLTVMDWLIAVLDSSMLNCRTKWGETALHIASAIGNEQIRLRLLSSGIDRDACDVWGRTADQVLSDQRQSHLTDVAAEEMPAVSSSQRILQSEFLSALSAAQLRRVGKPCAVTVKSLFGERVESIADNTHRGSTGNIVTPVATTISMSDVRHVSVRKAVSKSLEYPVQLSTVAAMLQDSSAYDVNGLDMFGLSALHKAASWNDVELLDLLLAHPEIDVNGPCKGLASSSSQAGQRAIHFAVECGAIASLRRLLSDSRVNASATSALGESALQLALRLRQSEEFISALQ